MEVEVKVEDKVEKGKNVGDMVLLVLKEGGKTQALLYTKYIPEFDV